MIRVVAFIKAVADHISDGCSTVSTPELSTRLTTCDTCSLRDGYSCSACGCYLPVKATWKTATCPEDRWPRLTTGQ